jgi:prepilin-type N-terminal cleavage/methylation domain-containing protein
MMNKTNNYGFTLVELLAVIVILAIILGIAIPGISGIIKNSTRGAFESDAKMVLKAVEYKTLENSDFDPLTITKANMQQELKISGDNYAQVTISIIDNKLKVILVGTGKWEGMTAYGTFKNMDVVNSEDFDEVPPVITMLGDAPASILQGSTYTDAGATAADLKDGDLTSNIVTTGSVNTAVIGAYTITYSVSDDVGNETTITRTVNVVEPIMASFGGSANDNFQKGIMLSDGYLTIGDSASNDGDLSGITKGANDAFIVRYDSNGDVVWKKKLWRLCG